ncbi:hypothetical protein D3C78_1349530 [compost metagenome]
MHDEGVTAGVGDHVDKGAHRVVAVDIVDADAVLDGDVDVDRVAHRLHAIGHQLRLGHQAGTEGTLLHPLRRTADVEVDLVVAPLCGQPGALRQLLRLGATQLQRDRVLGVVVAQMARHIAVQQRPGGHHLGVQPGVLGNQARKIAVVAIGPVQHRGHGQAARRELGGGRRSGGAGRCHALQVIIH